jgi:hypothetical protein
MDMQLYLLALDIDLPVTDEELDQGPISYLAARQEQEPIEVVVMALGSSPRLPAMDLLLGGAVSMVAPVKFPFAPPPDQEVNAAAEHRMKLAVQHLQATGCQASGIVSDEDLMEAIRAETRGHSYDAMILATSRQPAPWQRRALHRDPIHRLRRGWGNRLIVFPLGPAGAAVADKPLRSERPPGL